MNVWSLGNGFSDSTNKPDMAFRQKADANKDADSVWI